MNTETKGAGYGYTDDEEQIGGGSNISFGGNFGQTFLKVFKGIANGGKDGAEQDALEIVFDIAGTDKGYRQFPVTQAYGDNNVIITDPESPEMKEAFKNFNAIMTHILSAFVSREAIVTAFSAPINSFRDYVSIAVGLLPAGFDKIPLDIFMEWQWQITGENNKTFLQIPKKMKSGYWLKPAVAPVGSWKEVRDDNASNSVKDALKYVDDAGNVHPFVRNGWFVQSNFATQQKDASAANAGDGSAISANPVAGAAPGAAVAPPGW